METVDLKAIAEAIRARRARKLITRKTSSASITPFPLTSIKGGPNGSRVTGKVPVLDRQIKLMICKTSTGSTVQSPLTSKTFSELVQMDRSLSDSPIEIVAELNQGPLALILTVFRLSANVSLTADTITSAVVCPGAIAT